MNIAAPAYATMPLRTLLADLARWDELLTFGFNIGSVEPETIAARNACAAEIARRERSPLFACPKCDAVSEPVGVLRQVECACGAAMEPFHG